MKRPGLRQFVLALGLLLSLGAAYWVPVKEDEGSAVVGVTDPDTTVPTLAERDPDLPRLPLERLGHRTPTTTDVDPFPARVWFVPPPPAPPAPPPKPTAPPLPFQYLGKTEDTDGANLMVFLAKGNESYTVRQGEIFDGAYQLEGIERGNLVIQYLPLSVKQRLSIGLIE